jgi:cellulose synthase/poly-beta-1,6-N-acetylglucosamine synthase-like glycosyltransferase
LGILFIISLLLLVAYILLLGWYKKSWLQVRSFKPTIMVNCDTKVTVIIPARNEEENIKHCLQSIARQDYPAHLMEVIVADDFSTDATAAMVQQYGTANTRLLSLRNFINEKDTNSFKKKGIELAVQQSSGKLIITTDADCVAGESWISTMVAFYEKTNAAFIAAPVSINCTNRFVEMFQAVDFLTLQGITGAAVSKNAHQMCNGANLAYTREAFTTVNGFAGIDDIASGDDLLLMYKIFTRFPDKVFYLKSKAAIVATLPMNSWRGFFNQRIRWASKTTRYKDRKMFWTLFGVYFLNVACLLLLIISLIRPVYFVWMVVFLIVKTAAELNFLLPVARFFNKAKLLWLFPVMQPVHIIYTVIAGWLGTFGRYSWKGREVK